MDQKIVDFMVYREHQGDSHEEIQKSVACSDELSSAIQELIQRLRESNPIKQVS